MVSGGRTRSILLIPSKFVLVEGMAAAPTVLWIELGAVGILVPDCPGRSGRCDWFPLPLGATGLACIVRRAGDVSFLSDWMTVGVLGAAAIAGRLKRACPSRRQRARIDPKSRNSSVVSGSGPRMSIQGAALKMWASGLREH